MMTTIKTFIKRHAVLLYFILTFVLSWGSIILVVGPGVILGAKKIPEAQLPLVYVAMLVGPSIAGLLLTGLVDGGAGLRILLARLLKWRVEMRWYAVALLTAPLLATAASFALALFSSAFLPSIMTTDTKAALLLSGLLVGLLVGSFEELGWTGFAIPRLRLRYGLLATGLSVGFLWGAWHFLVFQESASFSTPLALALLIGRLFSWLPAYRVLLVWVYERTESLLVVMLMHASLVASTLLLQPAVTGTNLLIYIIAWAAALWIVVAVVAVANRGQIARSTFYQKMKMASR
ncbi:MAG: CPBP family intramembrane glutamic endopeptidase [Caldilineaceae bacterium]